MTSSNPYESSAIPEEEPIGVPSAVPSDDEYDSPPFHSPLWMGRVCCLLLIVIVFLDITAAYCALAVYRLNDESIPTEELDSLAIGMWHQGWNLAATINWPLFIVAQLLMIFWTYRCHRNLESLGHRVLDSKHIWALLCWFIPLLNLYCPYQVVREIWWRSQPLAVDKPESAPASHLVFWWWLLRMTALATSILGRWLSNHETSTQYDTFFRVAFFNFTSEILASVLAMLVIYRITHWQLSRHGKLQASLA